MIRLTKKLKEKYQDLRDSIRDKQKLIIAFSGGVDSALLAKIAKDILNNDAWAVFLDSETVPGSEKEAAISFAKSSDINFKILEVSQLDDEKFVKNDAQRCYYCRAEMAKILRDFAKEKQINTIAAGAQASDLDDYRPGITAFHKAGIWHPFIDFEFTKDDIRTLAAYLGLTVSNKPSMACLSSRIPYGQKITKSDLKMIENAEEYLCGLGFTQYRARIHDKSIRIEINPEEFDKLMKIRKSIIKRMKEIGFIYITLDLEGFRSGSMNEVLVNRK